MKLSMPNGRGQIKRDFQRRYRAIDFGWIGLGQPEATTLRSAETEVAQAEWRRLLLEVHGSLVSHHLKVGFNEFEKKQHP